jgi:hypothetical protein
MLEKKRYKDKFGLMNHNNCFPGNGARKLVGIFNVHRKIRKHMNTVVAFTRRVLNIISSGKRVWIAKRLVYPRVAIKV